MNPLFRIPIRLQLVIAVVIVALPALGIIVYSGIQQKHLDLADASLDAQGLVDRVASEQRILAASARQLVVTVSQLPEIRVKDTVKVTAVLRNILRLNSNINIVFVADRAGSVWASALPAGAPVSVKGERYFKNALASGRLSSGEFEISKITRLPTLILGYPYRDAKGELVGVVCVEICVGNYRALLDQTQSHNRTEMVLLDYGGRILFGNAEPESRQGTPYDAAVFRKMQQGGAADTSISTCRLDGSPRPCIVSYQRLALEGESAPYMYVRVRIPVDSVLSKIDARRAEHLALLTLSLVSALALVWYLGKRSVADRVVLLERASQSVADGDLQTRVADLVKGGELGHLGASFDNMAGQLACREQALLEKQRLLEACKLNLEELNAGLDCRVTSAVAESREKDRILIHQGRQAAMGEMIGNIAHQWRQPLNTLGLILQEVQITHDRDQLSREGLSASVKKALKLIAHMSSTIDDFRGFFRPDKERLPFNINQVVSRTLALIDPSLKNSGIDVRVQITADAGIVGYPNEYSQVLLNIILNCRDAFEGCDLDRPRVVTITVGWEEGRSVVTIADNAGGITDEVIDRVFDPYFTTKGPDKGTGIGLYMAKTIVEKHMGGKLSVRNADGGAEFRVVV